MRPHQSLVTIDGVQVVLLPMQVLTVTQKMLGLFSHQGRYAIDLGGASILREDVYAPCDIRLFWVQGTGDKTGVFGVNTKRVLIPGKLNKQTGKRAYQIIEPNRLSFKFWHDNDISDLRLDQVIKQGEPFYQEGNKGPGVTGNHVHIEAGMHIPDGRYPMYRTWALNWAIKGQRDLTEVFFVNDTIIKNSGGYAWETLAVQPDKPTVVAPIPPQVAIKVGDTVRVLKAINYDNGQPFKLYYTRYQVLSMKGNRVVIGRGKVITSAIAINHIKRV